MRTNKIAQSAAYMAADNEKENIHKKQNIQISEVQSH